MGFITAVFIIGRVLLGGFFLYNAYGHFRNIAGHTAYAQSKGVPSPKVAVFISGAMFALGGLAILLNLYIVLGMWLIVIALIPITFMMHSFWKATDPQVRMNEQIQFTKNMAILGGLFTLIAIGMMLG